MSKMIPSAERIQRAHALIQKAYDFPIPIQGGKYDLSYIAQVKDILRQAIDLVKFIPDTPTATPEMKAEVQNIYEEARQANQKLLH